MTAVQDAAQPTGRRPGPGRYLAPILTGLLIVAAGLLPWMLLARVNARVRPDLPWAAVVTAAYLGLLLVWLNGWGPPRGTADQRHQSLRLWPPGPRGADGLAAGVVMGLLGLLYGLWIVISRMSPTPDLSVYPTTSYRWSMFIMGGLTAGVVEEAGFRGYMQTGIERHDRENAIWLTSLVFAASHITHGIGAVLIMGPGLFIASMLYGTLARRKGTILPGMAIHVLGDLARVYFGVLQGDGSRLFVT
ncbi:MAG TPA: type II CAAX endopeptidase family protein [Vicinamibacterales bacterium]|nr:type II CAAX endopeptidase family protein [Vicinamibacterales bacterium]